MTVPTASITDWHVRAVGWPRAMRHSSISPRETIIVIAAVMGWDGGQPDAGGRKRPIAWRRMSGFGRRRWDPAERRGGGWLAAWRRRNCASAVCALSGEIGSPLFSSPSIRLALRRRNRRHFAGGRYCPIERGLYCSVGRNLPRPRSPNGEPQRLHRHILPICFQRGSMRLRSTTGERDGPRRFRGPA